MCLCQLKVHAITRLHVHFFCDICWMVISTSSKCHKRNGAVLGLSQYPMTWILYWILSYLVCGYAADNFQDDYSRISTRYPHAKNRKAFFLWISM
eukprot:g18240.t1